MWVWDGAREGFSEDATAAADVEVMKGVRSCAGLFRGEVWGRIKETGGDEVVPKRVHEVEDS